MNEAANTRENGRVRVGFRTIENQVGTTCNVDIGCDELRCRLRCRGSAVTKLNGACVDVEVGGVDLVFKQQVAAAIDIDRGGAPAPAADSKEGVALGERQCRDTAIGQGRSAGRRSQIDVDVGVVGVERASDGVGGTATGADGVGRAILTNGVAAQIHGPSTTATREIKSGTFPPAVTDVADGKGRSVFDVHVRWIELGVVGPWRKGQCPSLHGVGIRDIAGHRRGGNPRIQGKGTRARLGEVGGVDRAAVGAGATLCEGHAGIFVGGVANRTRTGDRAAGRCHVDVGVRARRTGMGDRRGVGYMAIGVDVDRLSGTRTGDGSRGG